MQALNAVNERLAAAYKVAKVVRDHKVKLDEQRANRRSATTTGGCLWRCVQQHAHTL